jgi:hypothetical protein
MACLNTGSSMIWRINSDFGTCPKAFSAR